MNSELFLKYFNQIQDTMTKQLQQDSNSSFKFLLDFGRSHKNKIITTYYDELDLYRELRNILVHEYVPLKAEIANPSDETIARIKMISEKMLHPKTVQEVFSTKVLIFEVNSPLTALLKQVGDYQYTQFPVFENEKLVGVLTENSLANFLARCVNEEKINLKDFTVGDILSADFAHNNYRLIGINKPIIEVEGILRHEIDQGNSSFVLLISKRTVNPMPTDLIGIITPFDMPKIMDNQ